MNSRPLHVITGASRGLGAALAEQVLQPGTTLLCLSRQRHPRLDALAAAAGAQCEQWQVDLAEPIAVAARLEAWLRAQGAGRHDAATLINNAATLPRVGPLQAVTPDDLSRALRVGLEAPLQLAAAFLRGTEGWGVPRRLLNISSGLGRRAMASQATYCAIKAGLDHATRAIALEGALAPYGVKAVSMAPGVIDTDMQAQLRGSDAAGFPDHARFVELQRSGQLDSPAGAAKKLLAYLRRPDFGDEPVADIRSA